jgi:hypothetical protein
MQASPAGICARHGGYWRCWTSQAWSDARFKQAFGFVERCIDPIRGRLDVAGQVGLVEKPVSLVALIGSVPDAEKPRGLYLVNPGRRARL